MPELFLARCENADCPERNAVHPVRVVVDHGRLLLVDEADADCPECGQPREVTRS
jgi:hypothetical protein